VLGLLNPTLNLQTSDVKRLPVPSLSEQDQSSLQSATGLAVEISRRDWDSQEVSTGFLASPLPMTGKHPIQNLVDEALGEGRRDVEVLAATERKINVLLSSAFDLESELEVDVDESKVALFGNSVHRFGATGDDGRKQMCAALVADLVSYGVGCILGRYSLDEPGLILANQGDTVEEYLAKVPEPSFMPDADNVIPIVDGDWFEDDIVARFRQFLRVAFGSEHFEDNLRFVTDSLGVKDLRDYFVRSFYKDHVQRYKKRPIYWLFSSPKGSFNALIYMHRYTPSTASTVLNEYLREFNVKLEASRQHHEHLATTADTPRQQAAARKEVDRLRKVLLELDEYEHDVLYPLATQQITIDLDDGVKANYPKFGTALKNIPGLEAIND